MLQEAINESRSEFSTYRYRHLKITNRVKMADVNKEKRYPPFCHAVIKKSADTKVGYGVCKKSGKMVNVDDMKNVECYQCYKKGHYASKSPEAKPKNNKGTIKVRKVEEPMSQKASKEPKSNPHFFEF